MIAVVLLFLFVSLLFYLVFGGADFGVGVLELFSSPRNRALNRQTFYRVIGPVWEANHVWLILVLVILWVGFPQLYTLVMVQLHIPLTLLLVGIVFRGSAFVFRHYDAMEDGSQKIYDRVFQYASVVCTFLIGSLGGALVSGKLIGPEVIETADFKALYLNAWLNPFALSMGVFISGIAAYLSATFLIGESSGKQVNYFRKKMLGANLVTVFSGLLVLLTAYWVEAPFLALLMTNPYSIVAVALASLLLIPIWRGIRTQSKIWVRFYVTAQIFLIFFAYVVAVFPVVVHTTTGGIDIIRLHSVDAVIQNLGVMLLIGGALILPGIYHLFKTFGLIKFSVQEEEGK